MDHYQFVPIGLQNGILEVGIVDPDNIAAMDALRFVSGKSNVPFKLFIVSPSDFKQAVTAYRQLTAEVDQALSEFNTESLAQEDTDLAIEQANIQQSLALAKRNVLLKKLQLLRLLPLLFDMPLKVKRLTFTLKMGETKLRFVFVLTVYFIPVSCYHSMCMRVLLLV